MHMMTIDERRTKVSLQDFYYQSFDDLPLYDQRYMPRWKTNKQVYVRVKGAHLIHQTQVKDLSLSGMCFYAESDIKIAQTVELKVHLTAGVNFFAEGVVIWTRTSKRGGVVAGVTFNMPSQEVQDLILQHAFGEILNEAQLAYG